MAYFRSTGRKILLGALCVLLLPAVTPARAGDAESRDYTLHVDGKPAGNANMTIDQREDGTTTVSCDTSIQVRVLLKTYKYTYRGREVWKDGRLQRLDSECNDDGQKYRVSAI